jgi:hypothetical protein
MATPNPPAALRKLVQTSRTWVRARITYRKLLDKRSAKPSDVQKAQKRLLKLTNDLEKSIVEFEISMRRAGAKPSKGGMQIPWGTVLKVVGAGAGALAQAMDRPENQPNEREVIEVEAEVID